MITLTIILIWSHIKWYHLLRLNKWKSQPRLTNKISSRRRQRALKMVKLAYSFQPRCTRWRKNREQCLQNDRTRVSVCAAKTAGMVWEKFARPALIRLLGTDQRRTIACRGRWSRQRRKRQCAWVGERQGQACCLALESSSQSQLTLCRVLRLV